MKHLITFIVTLIIVSSSFAVSADDWRNEAVPAGMTRVTVVFTNDVHGGIMRSDAEFLNPEFPPALGGATSAYKIIEALRERAKRDGQSFMLVDAGDIYQGAPIGTMTKGRAIIDYFNMIGMDAVVVGNHDLDQGYWVLDSMIAHSKFDWIASNLMKKGTNEVYPGVKPYIMKEFGGVKIALVGLTTVMTKYMSFPKNVATIDFKDEVPALQETIAKAKKDGAQAIWVMFHHGIQFDEEENYKRLLKTEKSEGFTRASVGDAQELVHRVPGIDVLFAGHIHVGKPKGWIHPRNHTLMMQNYGHGGNLGVVDLFINQKTGRLVNYRMPADGSMLLLLQEEQWGRDPVVDSRIKAIVDTVERGMDEVIGESLGEFQRGDGNSPMVSFVSDAMLDYGKTDIAFQNSGGVRENLVPGNITRRQIFHVEPFGNELVRFEVTGAFLKRLIEGRARSDRLGMGIAGALVTYDGDKAEGERIQKIEFANGRAFHADSVYKVTTTDYLLMGNSGMKQLTEIPQEKVDWLGIRLSDAIVKYIEKQKVVKPTPSTRWIDTAKK